MVKQMPAGCRMPAEWEPHEATWIAWPHNQDDWPGKFAAIPWVYAEIVRHLHQSEEVRILVNGPGGEQRAREVLDKVALDWSRVTFWEVPTNRSWMRDCGPMFVWTPLGHPGIVIWHFNGWAKYPNHRRDARVRWTLFDRVISPSNPLWINPVSRDGSRLIVLEGGAIDVNGEGLLLTTEECLLGDVQQRNPGFTRQDYEWAFAEYLGVKKVLWLGRPLDVTTLPMPAPVWFDGQRLPASYANFYIANDRVLVPTFNDPNDRRALDLLAGLFPDRKVVGIHAVDLVWGLGTLHCLTQQQPAGRGDEHK